MQELPLLLSEADLHIAQLSLNLLTSIAKLLPNALVNISDHILPEILTLVKSPLLQGAALTSMLELFQALVLANLPGLGYRELLGLLVNPVTSQGTIGPSGVPMPTLHKQAYHSLAKCVAALTVQFKDEAIAVAQQFLRDVQNPISDSQYIFALLVIGEIGRHM